MQRTNRKIIRALLAGFLLFLIAGICYTLSGCAPEPPEEYVEVTYFAEEGGAVYGNTYQKIVEPEDASYVMAVPNEGYRFVGWSDGNGEAKRIDGDASENSVFTAQFMKIPFYTVTYRVEGEGGRIWGSYKQRVREGDDGFPVIARSANGYRFVGWSDGVSDAERYEAEVTSDVELTAIFEPVQVNFYSGNYLVRKLALPELNEIDIDRWVGYQSNSVFERWKFTGNYASAMKGYKGDALALLQNHFNVFGITDVEDINLIASYTPAAGGSVPENFKTIAHALGGLDGNTYLNSEEVFLYYYEKGQRFFEADICFTKDKIAVISHDWNNVNYTYNEVMSRERAMDLFDLFTLMAAYPDITLDLDVLGVYYGPCETPDENYIEFFSQLNTALLQIDASAELYERIILEILPNENTTMYLIAKEYGFENFLYAEYYDSTSPITDTASCERVSKWCRENGVKYLSVESATEEWIDIMHSYGITVFAFTYNNPEEMYRLFDMGFDCIFTDFSFM